MTVSLSMTGVTILTKSRYKTRHSGAKELTERPDLGIILKSQEKLLTTSNKKVPRIKKKIKKLSLQCQEKEKREPKYVINKKEVIHRIKGFLNQMSGEKMLYFWTVTFPVNTPDDSCYILLNKWLTRLRQERMLREYLWVAERQENKTIHFHMVINQKMNVQKANKFMRASIMHSINKNEVTYSRQQAIKYNGVDISKDRKTKRVTNFAKQNKQKSLSNYLTKYVTKNDSSFTHLAWHSSRGYSNLITSVRFTYQEYKNSNTVNLLDQERTISTEYYTFRRWKGSPPKDLLMYLGLLNQHIQSKFN